ncbi:MAG: branched-chain amino acid ABC transporter permease [Acidimicrobiia bacterium]|nr:branched-chain amino acid ABC transporter permease [Acidimicrobiia bacterium]
MRTRRRLLTLLAIAALTVIASPLAAVAQPDETTMNGRLQQIDGDERTPVEGVRIEVRLDGEIVGDAVSDAGGEWTVPLPGGGVYEVELDTSTLPEGVALTDPERQVLPEVTVRDGQSKFVNFGLGPGLVARSSTLDRVGDLFVLGLKLGAIIALSAIGLSLIFGVTGLVNFAHGDLVTMGAAVAFWFNAVDGGPGMQILLASIPAILIVAGFGAAQEQWLWKPLRRRSTGVIALIVVSIGLSFAIRYIILVMLTGQPRPYLDYVVQDEVSFIGLETVPKNIWIILVSAVVLAGVGLFLQRTKLGTAMRAVSDNSDLAESSGIDVDRVIMFTWVTGAGLAAMGGIMLGISEQVQWDMGFKLLLLIFSAVILGGLGTAFGAMIGGFAIGISVEMSTLVVPNELKTAVALAILVVMLLVRPQGLLGRKERVG